MMTTKMTSGDLARASGKSQQTVQRYAKARLLEFEELPNGVKLFNPDQVQKVREIAEQRIANRVKR